MQLKQLDWAGTLGRRVSTWYVKLRNVAADEGVDCSAPFAVWVLSESPQRVRVLTTEQRVVDRLKAFCVFCPQVRISSEHHLLDEVVVYLDTNLFYPGAEDIVLTADVIRGLIEDS